MRRLVVNTLDGVMQAPGGPEGDPTGGSEHGGWSLGYRDEAMGERIGEFMGKPFDLVLGRKRYETFAAHWPHAREKPGAEQLNAAKKYVASRTLDSLKRENSQLLEGEAADAVARLKERDGPELQVHGSSNLVTSSWIRGRRRPVSCSSRTFLRESRATGRLRSRRLLKPNSSADGVCASDERVPL